MKKCILLSIVLLFSTFVSKASLSPFSTPTNLNATNILTNGATLSWIADTNANYWIVSYNVSQSQNINYSFVSSNTLQLNSLLSGVMYNWRVCMVDNLGDTSAWSNVGSFFTPQITTTCLPVTQLQIENMTSSGINVQWVPQDTSSQWEVVYGALGSNPEYDGTSTITQNYNVLLTGVSLGSWYQIAVRTICGDSTSSWSFINTKYISDQNYYLPVQQTFENSTQNTSFGFINGTVNPWLLDSAYNVTIDGNKAIYVSSDAGQSNQYYSNISAINYAYIDVNIPSYATSFYMDFKWRALGELSNDGLKIYLMSANTSLDINQLPSSSFQIGQALYYGNDSTWQMEHIDIPAQYVGQVRRVVFAWVNNSSLGGAGGAIVDDIYITARYCATPTNPTHSYITSSSAVLNWGFAFTQSVFNLQYRKVGSQVWNQVNGVTPNYYLSNLDDNTLYMYRVQADCTMEQSLWSAVDTFKTNILCLPPSDIKTLSYTNNKAIVAWGNSPVVLSWIFEYGQDNGASTIFTKKQKFYPNDTLNNLTPNTNYRVRIKAVSFQGDTSRYSDDFLFYTLCNSQTQYPYISITDTTLWTSSSGYTNVSNCWDEINDSVLLSPYFDFTNVGYPELSLSYTFFDTISTLSTIKLEFTVDGQNYFSLISLPQSKSIFNEIKVELPQLANQNGVRFSIIVESFSNTGNFFAIKDFVIKELCKSPQSISLIDLTHSTATLEWDQYSNNQDWLLLLKDNTTNDSSIISVSLHPFIVTALTPNTPYTVRLKSICAGDSSSTWTEKNFTTLVQSVGCLTPANFNCDYLYDSGVNDHAIRCKWDDTTNQSWIIGYKKRSAMAWSEISVNLVSEYIFRNLTLGDEYMFRIRTLCSLTDTSSWSDIENVKVGVSSLESITEDELQLKIYPNPAKDVINIELLNIKKDISDVKLVNNLGQIINRWEKLPRTIDVTKLLEGNYLLQIKNGNKITTKKIIIKK